MRQQIISMDERMTEINARMTKLEQRRNNPTSQGARLAPSYADILGTICFSTNVIQTPGSAERL